uniref:phospholipase D n=1 Tax=Trieres chinensis TaxID=1514140 RepID=A0A7S2EHY3_TRICV|mmetsp:Transcript_2456/g.5276  ORF Transcript_2456/g.5276 Transcript_2456/m.5276 type:complete len:384 (+) Transcript_2456:3-1154(+)
MKQNPVRESKLYDIDGNDAEFDHEWTSTAEDAESSWNVQLFRSINEDSALFDRALAKKKLKIRKGRVFDDSIQQAYIHQIRRAKRFIYIENQYFLGSCFAWSVPETTKCPHLIPAELVARIVRAIEKGEDFRVYVCVPLQPEGDPTSAAVQEVLRWQSRTMEFMYKRIGKAIDAKGIDAQPEDYLSFFCLTKRDALGDVPTEGLSDPPNNSIAAKCRASLRFMIYVHSKFAIFDDEYVIVGSANINERSMSGNRDTELAMGAYQPAFTKENAEGTEICGEVRTFRLALWAEHCGKHMEEHLSPSSKECMDAMRALGADNLDRYISDKVERNDSHLTRYPLEIKISRLTSHYHVEEMEGCKKFPDLGGSVEGENSLSLPNSITT